MWCSGTPSGRRNRLKQYINDGKRGRLMGRGTVRIQLYQRQRLGAAKSEWMDLNMQSASLPAGGRPLQQPHFAGLARLLAAGALDLFGESPIKKSAHLISRAGSCPVCAILIAISATAFTIQSKFSWPSEVISASGAGFRKSIA